MRRRSWAFPLIATLLLAPQTAARAGARAPSAPPVPPAREAPPMTTAAMASSSYPLAACGCAEERREART
ncbi:hypothetical protein ACVNF4_30735, partial [Streptomyces sp. S6]